MSIFGFFRKKTKEAKSKRIDTPTTAEEKSAEKATVKAISNTKIKDTIGGPYLVPGIEAGAVSIDRKADGKIYEIWQGDSMDTAITFLRAIPIKTFRHLYYVIVETPSGSAGKDCDGMFDETTGRSIS